MTEGGRYSDNSKKFVRPALRLCNLFSDINVETVEGRPHRGNTFSNNFFATLRASAL